MSSDERDPIVTKALAEVTVPEHRPGFWADLEAALAAHDGVDPVAPPEETPAPVTAATSVFLAEDEPDEPAVLAPVDEIVLDPATPADGAGRRWGRRAARALLAAAAVVVVAVAGILVAQRDDGGPDLSSQPGPSEPSTETTTPVTSTPPELQPEGRLVLDFVDALGRGDTETAAGMIGPRSEAYLIAQSGSVEDFLVQASEGYGAWSASTDRTVSIVRDVGGAAVVVLSGTVEQEGTTAVRHDAFPVVHTASADVYWVDLWAFDPDVEDQRIEVVEPGPSEIGIELHAGDHLQVATGPKGTFHFFVDGVAIEATGDGDAIDIPAGTRDGAIVLVVFQTTPATTYTALALPVISG